MAGWDQREATRHFSGVATYETTVTLTADEVKGKRLWLDFGDGTRVEDTDPHRLSHVARWADP